MGEFESHVALILSKRALKLTTTQDWLKPLLVSFEWLIFCEAQQEGHVKLKKQRGFLFILFYFYTHSFSNVDWLTAVYIMTIKKGEHGSGSFIMFAQKKHNLWYRITGTCIILLAAHYEHAWFPSASNNSRVIFFSIIYLLTYMGVFGFELCLR